MNLQMRPLIGGRVINFSPEKPAKAIHYNHLAPPHVDLYATVKSMKVAQSAAIANLWQMLRSLDITEQIL